MGRITPSLAAAERCGEQDEAAGYLEIRFTNDDVRGKVAWSLRRSGARWIPAALSQCGLQSSAD